MVTPKYAGRYCGGRLIQRGTLAHFAAITVNVPREGSLNRLAIRHRLSMERGSRLAHSAKYTVVSGKDIET